ncbi:MAG: hypothetical protein Q8O67_15915 [Deltaproteobacteria bacterium]|nr:hypothetical protein [Deltaproteobacteria bacterium]
MRGAVVVVVLCLLGCDPRPSLAQIGLFSCYRPELVEQCCNCLASRGTGHRDATCSEGFLVDGGISAGEDAVFGDGDQSEDDDGNVDEGEIPCLCSGNARTCRDIMNNGAGVTVPGACIDQLERTAPCEAACVGIVNFDPVPVR